MVSSKLPFVVSDASALRGNCADAPWTLESASVIAAARLACQREWMARIAWAAGLGCGRGPGVARKLPQVLVELAQKVLCGLCRSALHDETFQLRSLLVDPPAGFRHPFLDALDADGLRHNFLQLRAINGKPTTLFRGRAPPTNAF